MCNGPSRGPLVLVAEMAGGHACHALEKLDEERRVGEVHLVGDVGDGFVGVLEVNLDAGHQCLVNPLFGCLAAHLLDHGAQVARRDAQP